MEDGKSGTPVIQKFRMKPLVLELRRLAPGHFLYFWLEFFIAVRVVAFGGGIEEPKPNWILTVNRAESKPKNHSA